MNIDLIIEGGGAKAPGLVGAYEALVLKGFDPIRLAGSSAGAIVAAMIAAGYTPAELKKIIFDLNFYKLADGGRFGTKTFNLLVNKGIHRGDELEALLSKLLSAKGVTTFGDLKIENAKIHKHSLKVLLSDITNSRLTVFPDDAGLYGLKPDEINVAWAVRASCSIPGFFRPVRLDDTYFIDGGALSNFPIWLFDERTRPPEWPTFGLLLDAREHDEPNRIDRWPYTYISAILSTIQSGRDRMFNRPEEYIYRTIRIPVGNVKATDFNMSQQTKERLYISGVSATIKFLDSWSWNQYIDWATKTRGIRGENDV